MKSRGALVNILFFLLISLPICIAHEMTISEQTPIPDIKSAVSALGESAVSESTPKITTYFYAGKSLIATKDSIGVKYYASDRLGNNRLTTDGSGLKVGESKTLPFGEEIQNTNNAIFTFTGKELDDKLYYFGARYYDSSLARFTNIDPAEDDMPYGYVSNNPLIFIDPDGRKKYAVVVGFRNLNVLSDGQTQTSGVVYGLNNRVQLSASDEVDVIILYSQKFETDYNSEEKRSVGLTMLATLKNNILGGEYSLDPTNPHLGMKDDWEYVGEKTGAKINTFLLQGPQNQEDIGGYLNQWSEDYDEFITLSHGTTKGKQFTFLDGLGIVTFTDYLSNVKWSVDISCGSTMPGDQYSYPFSGDPGADTDGLFRKWSDTTEMAQKAPEIKKRLNYLYYTVDESYRNEITNHPVPMS